MGVYLAVFFFQICLFFVHEGSQAQDLHITGCIDVVQFLPVLHYLQARSPGGEENRSEPSVSLDGMN
jgi:hypothetical protein